MPRTKASANPCRMLKLAMLPGIDLGAGVAMVGVDIAAAIAVVVAEIYYSTLLLLLPRQEGEG